MVKFPAPRTLTNHLRVFLSVIGQENFKLVNFFLTGISNIQVSKVTALARGQRQ